MQRLVSLCVFALVLSVAMPAEAGIRIATVGPVTGPLAALGEQMLAGARQAVADINAAGGVLGKKLVLEVGDDQCDPKQAVATANRMVAKGVVFVAGHFCSGASIPASKVYGEEGVIMISPASTSPKLTDEGGPGIYRVCGRDDQQGGVLGRFLARRFAGQRIAFVHDKSAYGKGLAMETLRAMREAGQKEAMFEAYTAGEKDYTALVSKLKAARIDVLFVGGYHTEAGLILRQMRAQGLGATMVGGDTLVVRDYWSIAGRAATGTLFTFAPDAAKSPAAQEVVARYRARGVEPAGYVLYTYAAVQAWAQAAEKAGTADPDTVIKTLRKLRLQTVIGTFHFKPNGDVNLPPYGIYHWTNGAFEQLGVIK
ncbi:MAG: branched-chain amino acid ABC transporter substrate-binding protein [Hyphomicrobiales bacterium]|nr:branched-chain amino acid ABC transporter substrate-binding protein [Hyphomicrobiales bacterium]